MSEARTSPASTGAGTGKHVAVSTALEPMRLNSGARRVSSLRPGSPTDSPTTLRSAGGARRGCGQLVKRVHQRQLSERERIVPDRNASRERATGDGPDTGTGAEARLQRPS